VANVAKVTVKKSHAVLFVINKPEVFRAPGSDTYVIFGEAKVEDASASSQEAAAAAFQQRAQAPRAGGGAGGAGGAGPAAAAAGGEDDNEVVENDAKDAGVEEKDIKLVMDQASVSRKRAIGALKANGSDIVTAIMSLTM